MRSVLADVRYGVRMLRRNKGFTFVATLTLALGIGANTAMFTVLNAVVLRPLPFADPERLVALHGRRDGRSLGAGGTSLPDFQTWKTEAPGFESMATTSYWPFNLVGAGEPMRIPGARVSGDFFAVLGVRPQLGRTVTAADDRPEAPPVAVLGDGLWRRAFGSDPAIVGRTIMLNGIAHTVVGVMPRGFAFPSAEQEIWAPLATELHGGPRDARFLYTVGRLAAGTDVRQAQAALDSVAAGLAAEFPATNKGWGAHVVPLHEAEVAGVRPALLVLAGAVGFVLLIACANVSNLLLARAAFRRREVAIRTALGASRARIARQFVSENAVLGLAGGAGGLVLAAGSVALLRRFGPPDIPRLETASVDLRVLAFTATAALLTGIVLGLLPALQLPRRGLSESLGEGDRAGALISRSRLRRGLVVAETALALTLLVGGGLLIRSFRNLLAVPLGFEAAHLATGSVFLTPPRYLSLESQRAFVRRAIEGASALPGVVSAATTSHLPLDSGATRFKFVVEGRSTDRASAPSASYRAVSPEYFHTMAIPVRAGRPVAESDTAGAPLVVVINDTMARRFWPGESPLGRRLAWVPEGDPAAGQARWHTVVGVVGDVRSEALAEDEGASAYVSYAQRTLPFLRGVSVVIRTDGDPRVQIPALRAAIHAVDPEQPVFREQVLEDLVARSVEERRFLAILLQAFAALAAVLAMIGIYGLLSYTVGQRTREIGIRMALGASPTGVVGLVLREGLTLALAGIAVGVPLSLALSRLLERMLFGVAPGDPVTLGMVTVGIAMAAALACAAPATRATRVSPMAALRHD